jgi:hypothetical protein
MLRSANDGVIQGFPQAKPRVFEEGTGNANKTLDLVVLS